MANKLLSRQKQRKDESFQTYWFSILELIDSLKPNMTNEDRIDYLIGGMRSELKTRVTQHMMLHRVNTLDELLMILIHKLQLARKIQVRSY